ncbi:MULTISPECIES: hypothetical protein [unclassified Microbacterium]|uniref:hypothetical protein n=1 Tax=unclassified Microbacterium TaxID=2609290 RepID=UPI001D7C5CE1|nr:MULTISPECIES: hypothetical protein [unclassified Microbacterium]MBT9607822.1 hypothetical protein [Microbacterium sp.]CAH0162570.1 hypothetical protein SRABI128_00826 [Microbacterium sp. Bi128]
MTKKKLAAWVATAALVLTAMVAPPAATASGPAELTDEQMVLGLVFGVGDFADRIGTTADVRPSGEQDAGEAAAAYERSAQQVTGELLAGSPELGTALDQIRQGDPALTEEAFATIGDVLDGYAAQQVAAAETVPADPDQMQALSPCGVAVVCWAYAAAAVHNTVVVTGAAAVVVAAALWCGAWAWCGNSAAPTSEKSQLMREQFAVDVTRAVAAS